MENAVFPFVMALSVSQAQITLRKQKRLKVSIQTWKKVIRSVSLPFCSTIMETAISRKSNRIVMLAYVQSNRTKKAENSRIASSLGMI